MVTWHAASRISFWSCLGGFRGTSQQSFRLMFPVRTILGYQALSAAGPESLFRDRVPIVGSRRTGSTVLAPAQCSNGRNYHEPARDALIASSTAPAGSRAPARVLVRVRASQWRAAGNRPNMLSSCRIGEETKKFLRCRCEFPRIRIRPILAYYYCGTMGGLPGGRTTRLDTTRESCVDLTDAKSMAIILFCSPAQQRGRRPS